MLVYMVWGMIAAGIVLTGWENLYDLERLIMAGDRMLGVLEATAELRRLEDGYFLSGAPRDHGELLGQVRYTRTLLDKDDIQTFVKPQAAAEIRGALGQYEDMLVAPAGDRSAWERGLRDRGREVMVLAGKISQDGRAARGDALQEARGRLAIGAGVLLVAVFIGALWIYRRGVRPLAVMEGRMRRVSEGEFAPLPVGFDDSEFVMSGEALNRMLLELQNRQRYIVESEKLATLGTLAFGVAHELNNPLSNISSSCQILREELQAGSLDLNRELLARIEAETVRAHGVVNWMLEYSRAGEKTRFQLSEAVFETMRLMRAEVPRRISILTSVPDKMEIFTSRQKIQQILLNLIKNAVDAIGESDGEIVISAFMSSGQARIVVQDDGRGIDRECLPEIFDPFFTRGKGGKGYGLGLFIVRSLVEELCGDISVESEAGSGATFTVILPLE